MQNESAEKSANADFDRRKSLVQRGRIGKKSVTSPILTILYRFVNFVARRLLKGGDLPVCPSPYPSDSRVAHAPGLRPSPSVNSLSVLPHGRSSPQGRGTNRDRENATTFGCQSCKLFVMS